jgi:hypothetical protein
MSNEKVNEGLLIIMLLNDTLNFSENICSKLDLKIMVTDVWGSIWKEEILASLMLPAWKNLGKYECKEYDSQHEICCTSCQLHLYMVHFYFDKQG